MRDSLGERSNGDVFSMFSTCLEVILPYFFSAPNNCLCIEATTVLIFLIREVQILNP